MRDELLTTRKAAAHIGRSYPWLRTLICQGRGPVPEIRGRQGSSSFFTVAELDRWSALYAKNDCIPPALPTARSRVVIEHAIVELDGIAAAAANLVERTELYSMAHALRWALGEVQTLALIHGAQAAK